MALKLLDDFEDEFDLIGVRTTVPNEIRFIYLTNQAFNMQFKRIEDLDVKVDNDIYCHSLYHYEQPSTEQDFYIIKQISHTQKVAQGGGFSLFDATEKSLAILPRHKIYDYFFKIYYHTERDAINLLSLNEQEFVRNSAYITDLTDKEKKNFLL